MASLKIATEKDAKTKGGISTNPSGYSENKCLTKDRVSVFNCRIISGTYTDKQLVALDHLDKNEYLDHIELYLCEDEIVIDDNYIDINDYDSNHYFETGVAVIVKAVTNLGNKTVVTDNATISFDKTGVTKDYGNTRGSQSCYVYLETSGSTGSNCTFTYQGKSKSFKLYKKLSDTVTITVDKPRVYYSGNELTGHATLDFNYWSNKYANIFLVLNRRDTGEEIRPQYRADLTFSTTHNHFEQVVYQGREELAIRNNILGDYYVYSATSSSPTQDNSNYTRTYYSVIY